MPTFETAQFGSFDGKDNRKELIVLFERLGAGLPDAMARRMRADFLQNLISMSVTGLSGAPIRIDQAQCTPVGAYKLFVAITGCLGVPIERAAKMLDFQVSNSPRIG